MGIWMQPGCPRRVLSQRRWRREMSLQLHSWLDIGRESRPRAWPEGSIPPHREGWALCLAIQQQGKEPGPCEITPLPTCSDTPATPARRGHLLCLLQSVRATARWSQKIPSPCQAFSTEQCRVRSSIPRSLGVSSHGWCNRGQHPAPEGAGFCHSSSSCSCQEWN